MPGVDIRRALPSDADAVARLYVALRDHHRELQPHNPRYAVTEAGWDKTASEALTSGDAECYIALRDGRVAGFMKLAFVPKPWGISCEIETLIVEDEARDAGIGSALLNRAELAGLRRGAKAMRVDVLLENERGRSFYERRGFDSLAVRYGKMIR